MINSLPNFPSPTIFIDLPDPTQRVDWKVLFENDQPVELEVGSGKGLFLVNAASKRPDHNFVGIEVARKYAQRAADRIDRSSLSNVRVFRTDARPFLCLCVPDRSLVAVHLYFPDPWWKKRHRKRRVFTGEFLQRVNSILQPGGLLSFATDVEEYFGVMMAHMAECPAFQPLPSLDQEAEESSPNYLTNFERKYRIEGRPIYRARFTLNTRE